MPAGRPRVPDNVKKKRGTYRDDRKEPKLPREPGEKCPARPARLHGSGKLFWDKWAKVLWDDNWLSAKTAVGFTELCEAHYLHDKMRAYCEKNGYTYTKVTKAGISYAKRPEWDIMHQMKLHIGKLNNDFGFTSLSERRHVTAKKPAEPKGKEKEDILKFVSGK